MLTGDMLRFILRSGKFHCRFADTSGREGLETAAGLIDIYRKNTGQRRCDVAELLNRAVRSAPDPKLAAGLEKLLADGAEYASAARECDLPVLRDELFRRSGKLLSEPGNLTEEKFRNELSARLSGVDIYGDLPDFEVLAAPAETSPERLLHRYNTALVQGLLMHSQGMTLIIADPDQGELRKVIKFMKFCRLLAAVSREKDNAVKLEISGPFALLENSRKYALQLAMFFPAVLKLSRYRLQALVNFRGRQGKLELDEKSGLISHYSNITSYIPEEIRIFHRLFREKASGWTVVGETPFLQTGKGDYCFPDLSFRHDSGTLCHLELFHRWHRGKLPERIHFLEKENSVPLIIGVDRSAADKDTVASFCRDCPKAEKRIFMFRDFPGVETVVKQLNLYKEMEEDEKK